MPKIKVSLHSIYFLMIRGLFFYQVTDINAAGIAQHGLKRQNSKILGSLGILKF
jgi:hypothetical protein